MGDTISTREKRLTFFGSVRMTFTMFSWRWPISAVFMTALWSTGLIASSNLIDRRTGKRVTVTVSNRRVTETTEDVT